MVQTAHLTNGTNVQLQKGTRMRSPWAPLRIPTLKFFTHQHTRVPQLGHDSGNQMKIPFKMFLIFYL